MIVFAYSVFALIATSALVLVAWIVIVEIGEWASRRRFNREWRELNRLEAARKVTGGRR